MVNTDRKDLLKDMFIKHWELEFSIAGDQLTEDCIDIFLEEKKIATFDEGAKIDLSQLIEQLVLIFAFIESVLNIYDRFRRDKKSPPTVEDIEKEVLKKISGAENIPPEERKKFIEEEVVKKIHSEKE